MSVPADADQPQIDGRAAQLFGQRGDALARAVYEMRALERNAADKALLQILPKACRVRFGQIDVFVQMEHLDTAPVNVLPHERGERVELRRAGR